ncbi:MAG: Rieske 2Fe-2S domain-containing protein [Blastocatellia bacterium]|nr:Rieske 2Fe-2S domain-containing protein [Blastocatellia bacterium]
MADFEIESDIRKARTLSSEFYTDERYFELSKEKIFVRSWQFIGTSHGVNNLKPVFMLEGFLNEPVLITGTNGRVACYSNVCTHRGKILVEKECKAGLIRCGYHGRRFSLEGKFLSMPEFEGVEDFPSEQDDLTRIRSAIWGKFLFASIDPIGAFTTFIPDAEVKLSRMHPEDLKLVSTRDYEVRAHWALYCENYLEGFHIPFVHHSLNAAIEYSTYTTDTFRYSILQTAFDSEKNIAAYYLFIFPNMMFNFYPWGVSVNIVKPITPDKTLVSFLTFVSDESKRETGAGSNLDKVEMEDEAVVESVQRGIHSRFYKPGRYSPSREQGTHHFHRLIAEFMG